MDIDAQDRMLTLAMREALAQAKVLMPDSIICIFSFTQADDGSAMGLNKAATNSEDREYLMVQVHTVMAAFASAPVIDLSDVKGGVQ